MTMPGFQPIRDSRTQGYNRHCPMTTYHFQRLLYLETIIFPGFPFNVINIMLLSLLLLYYFGLYFQMS